VACFDDGQRAEQNGGPTVLTPSATVWRTCREEKRQAAGLDPSTTERTQDAMGGPDRGSDTRPEDGLHGTDAPVAGDQPAVSLAWLLHGTLGVVVAGTL
jgi:hypothetical protein